MAKLDKQDWEFITSYLIPKKYELSNCYSSLITFRRKNYYDSLMRTCSFMAPELKNNPVFVQAVATNNMNTNLFNEKAIIEEIVRVFDNNIDFKDYNNIVSFYNLITNENIGSRNLSNITTYLINKYPDFIDDYSNGITTTQAFSSEATTLNIIGIAAKQHFKKTKTHFKIPQKILDAISNNRFLNNDFISDGLKKYKQFFDGMLNYEPEQVKHLITIHKKAFEKNSELKAWLDVFPEHLKPVIENKDNVISENNSITLKSKLEFTMIDLFTNESTTGCDDKKYTANHHNNALSYFVFAYLQNKFPEISTYENFNCGIKENNHSSGNYSADKVYIASTNIQLNQLDDDFSIEPEKALKFKNLLKQIKEEIIEIKTILKENKDFKDKALKYVDEVRDFFTNDEVKNGLNELTIYKDSWILNKKLSENMETALNQTNETDEHKQTSFKL